MWSTGYKTCINQKEIFYYSKRNSHVLKLCIIGMPSTDFSCVLVVSEAELAKYLKYKKCEKTQMFILKYIGKNNNIQTLYKIHLQSKIQDPMRITWCYSMQGPIFHGDFYLVLKNFL